MTKIDKKTFLDTAHYAQYMELYHHRGVIPKSVFRFRRRMIGRDWKRGLNAASRDRLPEYELYELTGELVEQKAEPPETVPVPADTVGEE